MTEHGICAKCKKSVGCPYADDRITGCKNFVLEPGLKLTGKEWLHQCTTEQLAEVLYNFFTARTFCHLCPEGDVCDIGYKCKYKSGEVDDFVEWLKKPHEVE